MEGRSLAPLLKNPRERVRDSIFYAYRHLQRGVRAGDWKLILYHVDGQRTTQLFHLKDDPWETRNLVDEPAHAGRVRELTALLIDWMRRSDDRCDPRQMVAPDGTRHQGRVGTDLHPRRGMV